MSKLESTPWHYDVSGGCGYVEAGEYSLAHSECGEDGSSLKLDLEAGEYSLASLKLDIEVGEYPSAHAV